MSVLVAPLPFAAFATCIIAADATVASAALAAAPTLAQYNYAALRRVADLLPLLRMLSPSCGYQYASACVGGVSNTAAAMSATATAVIAVVAVPLPLMSLLDIVQYFDLIWQQTSEQQQHLPQATFGPASQFRTLLNKRCGSTLHCHCATNSFHIRRALQRRICHTVCHPRPCTLCITFRKPCCAG